MGRKKKDARQVKKQVSVFMTDEESFRVKQMAQTWGVNVSQMVAHLINQAYTTGAYLNGYDKLSQDERADLVARRAYSNFLTARRSEAARVRNFDRRNGLDRGLTNVMVIAAPEDMTYFKGKDFPGIFCKNLGDVWIVPYGLLNKVSVVEIIEFPCYASVFDYFAGKAIAPGALTDFIDDKRDYVLSSFGEKAVLKRLFELYGHLRFPPMRQAKNIVREQSEELATRISQYQKILEKLKQVRAQKVAQAREIIKLQEEGYIFRHNVDRVRAFIEDNEHEIASRPLTPQESLAALQDMMPEGSTLDEQTLERLQALANAPREMNEEYFAYLRAQIDELYHGLDSFYDQEGKLEAYQLLEEAKSANTYYDKSSAKAHKEQEQDNAFVLCDLAGAPQEKLSAPISLDEFLQANPDLSTQITNNQEQNSAPDQGKKTHKVALPKYLSSTAADMASRFKKNKEQIQQNSSDYASGDDALSAETLKEEIPIPMPKVYSDQPSDERFVSELDLNEFTILPKGSRKD